LALRVQAEQDEIRKGYRPPPEASDKHRKRPFAEVRDEYFSWGESQGGRRGRPWSERYAGGVCRVLTWWEKRLGLVALGDLDGVLPRVEEALRELQAQGLTGKTVSDRAGTLKWFCSWCVKRGYLRENPLRSLAPFDTTPQTARRALTQAEIGRLLDAAPEERRLLYEVAICSGLRAKELRSLSEDDLDSGRGGLHFRAEWTKNRKSGFQPLPAALVRRLVAFTEAGTAEALYAKHRRGGKKAKGVPERPLLYVPQNTWRVFETDRKKAEIKLETFGGKADFHGLRVAYVSFVLGAGGGAKEAQTLARHANPSLTLGVYGRARDERLAELAEAVGAAVLPAESIAIAQRKAAGAESSCVPIGSGVKNAEKYPADEVKGHYERPDRGTTAT